MINSNNHFILAGNGAYNNRGCEAIVRGTISILKQYYKNPEFLVASRYFYKSQFYEQTKKEYDPLITHKKIIRPATKDELFWWVLAGLRIIAPKARKYIFYKEMLPYLERTKAVLSVGGDNYSLDYEYPILFTDLDDLVINKNKPLIIWGASVGPFDKDPAYEKYIIKHFHRVTGIFARESETIKYLADKGLTKNVYRVADPAFLMEPVKPGNFHDLGIINDAVGINFSPLMAKYVTDGDLIKWLKIAKDIILRISGQIKRKIYLIPHGPNDYEFLSNVFDMLNSEKQNVSLIPNDYNAAEIKYIIGKMSVFAGARMHATIASFSSFVPTLSFAYSMKGVGLNKDIFGHTEYCIEGIKLKPEIVAEKIEELLKKASDIRNHLSVTIPKIQNLAMDAGKYLNEILET